ncbi:hypothetical protein TSAR_015756 [Trichomalopsis sarcophagae]|uniref:Uncharacterized protein n=1 Tax=Trichomalopsis sarcophagae TaxID=543379 RepID=A0A232EFC9_9HYME|nr:hypothetical protein TSAR_015756 [Trichomalopsis sarcophagae]
MKSEKDARELTSHKKGREERQKEYTQLLRRTQRNKKPKLSRATSSTSSALISDLAYIPCQVFHFDHVFKVKFQQLH